MARAKTVIRLVRVIEGVDMRKWVPVYYLEARLSAQRPWRMVTDGDSFYPHYSKVAAQKQADKLQKKLHKKRF